MIKRILHRIKYKLIDLELNLKRKIGIQTSTLKLKSGELFRIRNNDNLGISVLKGEDFEEATQYEIMSRIRENMTVLDIGANIGYYTVQMATKVGPHGKVIAFEPSPIIWEELQYNVSLNKLDNVILNKTALSNINGYGSFCLPQTGYDAHASLKPNKTFDVSKLIEVKTERLDDVLCGLGVSDIGFIKIDVEGAERDVFEGAVKLLSAKQRPVIIFESAEHLCQPFGHCVFDVLYYLYKYDYTVEQFDYGMWRAIPKK